MSKQSEDAKKLFEERERSLKAPTKAQPAQALTEQQRKDMIAKQNKMLEESVNKKLNVNGQATISEAVKHLYDIAVVQGKEDYRGRVSEEIFVNYFLPYFIEPLSKPEEVTPDKKEQREKILKDWISVAGNSFNEVAVVDQQNNVLFVVPALNNSRVINPVRKDGAVSFETIAHMAERLQMLSPAQSLNYQNDRLHAKLVDMADGKHKFKESEEQWKNIFKRYEHLIKPANSSSVSTESSVDDDDIIYD